jgi:hypothetical protein
VDISKLKRELASRHLYDNARGKLRELAIVTGFLERLQLDAEIIEGERPDFSLSFGRGSLHAGLELTLLNADGRRSDGSPERRLHSMWKKIAETLRERLSKESAPLPHAYGSVFFRTASASALNEIDRAQFCEEVVISLRSTILSELGFRITDFDPTSTPLLRRTVEHMYVRVFPSGDRLLWWCSDLQSGPVADPSQAIEAAVIEKQEKARSYRWGAAHERWLLIYAAGEGLADLATSVKDPKIGEPTPFTQVFLWDKFPETIHSLSPKFAAIFTEANTLHLRYLPQTVRPYLKNSGNGP